MSLLRELSDIDSQIKVLQDRRKAICEIVQAYVDATGNLVADCGYEALYVPGRKSTDPEAAAKAYTEARKIAEILQGIPIDPVGREGP